MVTGGRCGFVGGSSFTERERERDEEEERMRHRGRIKKEYINEVVKQ